MKKIKHGLLIFWILFYVIFTSMIMFAESGVLLFQIWHLMTTLIWIVLAIKILVLFRRLFCLSALRIELQKFEKEMNNGKV